MMDRRIGRILDLLRKEYGRPKQQKERPPLDELILTILSQNTASINTRRAYAALRARFEDWDSVRRADVGEVAEAIRPGGLAEIRAARIKEILERLYTERRETNLDWFYSAASADIRNYLLGLPGVGEKTAACVLLFSLGRPVLPVDTHVYRVSQRLGLIEDRVNIEQAHRILQEMVPKGRVYEFHINLIQHGRRVCKARKPNCTACVTREECSYFVGVKPD